MLYGERDEEANMSAQKEISITFRCDEATRDWLYAQAGTQDLTVSEFVRAAIFLAAPQIRAIRGLSRVDLEDMRDAEKTP